MIKKIIGIFLIIIGGLLFLIGSYRIIDTPISKLEIIDKTEIYKAVDGKIIEDEIDRREHNKHVFKMQRLDVELNKTKGLISNYEASKQLIDINANEEISILNENKNKELLQSQENSIKAFYTAMIIYILVGLGLIIGGFFLYRNGKKA
ncbi:MAG TPA: hypothetical protein PK784_01155 [Tenuifilaceae bacterium]|nr:hypothetical protein [Tenuifilaceae bacterium]